MIEIKDITGDKNLIILAPNGAGKTRTSKKIYEKYKKDECYLFSADTIKDLVIVDANRVYIGRNANEELKKQKLIDEIKNSKSIKKNIKEKFGSSSLTVLKETSHYFNKESKKFKKLDDFLINSSLENYSIFSKNIKEIISIDCNVDDNIYEFVENDIGSILDIENNIGVSNEKIIIKGVFDDLNYLKNYTIDRNLNYCLLCGYENNDIANIITNNINLYKIEENLNLIDKINYYVCQICDYDINNLSLEQKIQILYNYKDSVDKNNIMISNYILGLNLENGSTLYEQLTEISKIDKIIQENKLDDRKLVDYKKIILDDIKRLIYPPNNISIYFNNDNRLCIDVDNNNKNFDEVLSTSELKRLCLAVLKAEIMTNDLKCVIFDDPVDSCDDYYIKVASNYISEIVTMDCKNNGSIQYYIFTHLYEMVYNFVVNSLHNKNFTKFEFICYYQKPDYKYDNKISNCLLNKYKFKTSEEIIAINVNEIYFLKYLQEQDNDSKDDIDCFFVSLCVINTLRSLIVDINHNIQKVYYIDEKNDKKLDVYESFKQIQDSYIHVSEKNLPYSNLQKLYNNIIKKCVLLNKDNNCNESINELREEYLNKKYSDIKFSPNIIIKTILYKILRVENCKYNLEYKLLKRLNYLNIPENKLKNVTRKPGLYCKINTAYKMYQNDYIINEIKTIHEKYNPIINDFSHGFSRMISPYLMTNIIDIAKLEYEIDKIDIGKN